MNYFLQEYGKRNLKNLLLFQGTDQTENIHEITRVGSIGAGQLFLPFIHHIGTMGIFFFTRHTANHVAEFFRHPDKMSVRRHEYDIAVIFFSGSGNGFGKTEMMVIVNFFRTQQFIE